MPLTRTGSEAPHVGCAASAACSAGVDGTEAGVSGPHAELGEDVSVDGDFTSGANPGDVGGSEEEGDALTTGAAAGRYLPPGPMIGDAVSPDARTFIPSR